MITAIKSRFHEEPFKPEHLTDLTGVHGYATDITPEYIGLLSKHPAYTAFYDGKPIGAGGVIIAWKGVGEAWSITLPGAAQCRREYLAWAREGLRHIIDANKLHRVQCSVLEDYTAGRRWAVALGFKPECWLKFSGPNKEHSIQFVMFPEGDD